MVATDHTPAGGAADRHIVHVRGPHLSANGVLVARTRLLTSRQALFTYPDAENTAAEAESADGGSIVRAACLPAQCLLMNQAAEFAIVALPPDFCGRAGVLPVELAGGGPQGSAVLEGDEVAIVANIGGGAASGCTVVARLMVDDVSDAELRLHALDPWAKAEVGSPIFRNGRLVALVVALPSAGAADEGLRALRIEAIVERLKKRQQLEDALDAAPDVRFNSDQQPAVRVPDAANAGAPGKSISLVYQMQPIDHVRKALLVTWKAGDMVVRTFEPVGAQVPGLLTQQNDPDPECHVVGRLTKGALPRRRDASARGTVPGGPVVLLVSGGALVLVGALIAFKLRALVQRC